MNILSEIIAHKKRILARQIAQKPFAELQREKRSVPILDFRAALVRPSISVIAEVKRSSPSEGNINTGADPASLARIYEQSGAAAISVLTDEKYFGGSLEDLKAVKATVSIPVLRKDFIVSEYQVYESWLAGADAILLIADALTRSDLHSLYSFATDLGLAVLVEAHEQAAISVMCGLKPQIIGVNARNLNTMETDIDYFSTVKNQLPESAVKVAESGLFTVDDLRYVADLDYDATLIGTALMRSADPGKSLVNYCQG